MPIRAPSSSASLSQPCDRTAGPRLLPHNDWCHLHGFKRPDVVSVPAGLDGRVWSFQLTAPKPVTTDVELLAPLRPYVAADPTRLAVFAD